jgi:hypothetical protein
VCACLACAECVGTPRSPAGPPQDNDTFICPPALDSCFHFVSTAIANFATAEAACKSMGGQLPSWTSEDKQVRGAGQLGRPGPHETRSLSSDSETQPEAAELSQWLHCMRLFCS